MSNYYALVETVKKCSYPTNMLDYFANTIIELVSSSPTAKVYASMHNGDNITTIKYNIQTPFKEKVFEIPILIYLTKNMPYEAPEFYLERGSDTGINPKNTEIDQRTNRIYSPSLINWNSQMTLFNVTKEVTDSFKRNFPIYKITKPVVTTNTNTNTGNYYGQSNVNRGGNYMGGSSYYQPNTGLNTGGNNYQPYTSGTNYVNPNPITVNPVGSMGYSPFQSNTINPNPPSSYTNLYQNMAKQPPHNNTIYQSLYQQNQNQLSNTGQSNYNTTNAYPNNNMNSMLSNTYNPKLNTNQFTSPNNGYNYSSSYIQPQTVPTFDKELSNVNLSYDSKKAEDEMKKILIQEIKQSVESKIREESKRNKQIEEKLKNYKNEFGTQIDKYQKFISREEEIFSGLKKLIEDIEREIQNVQMYLAKMQDRMLNSSNFENQINISNTILLNIISIEATIEDFMSIIKKSYERNIINFNETCRTIRALSREAMKIKFSREKIIRQL